MKRGTKRRVTTNKSKRESAKGGAPSKYSRAILIQVKRLAYLGCTDIEIAEFFDIHVDTLYEWKKKHKEFSEALKQGKTKADSLVAESLFKRAIGYKYKEETFERITSKDAASSDEIIKPEFRKKVVVKELPPDVGAAFLWLKNRQRDKWKDKHDFKLDFDKMSSQEIENLFSFILKRSNAG